MIGETLSLKAGFQHRSVFYHGVSRMPQRHGFCCPLVQALVPLRKFPIDFSNGSALCKIKKNGLASAEMKFQACFISWIMVLIQSIRLLTWHSSLKDILL